MPVSEDEQRAAVAAELAGAQVRFATQAAQDKAVISQLHAALEAEWVEAAQSLVSEEERAAKWAELSEPVAAKISEIELARAPLFEKIGPLRAQLRQLNDSFKARLVMGRQIEAALRQVSENDVTIQSESAQAGT